MEEIRKSYMNHVYVKSLLFGATPRYMSNFCNVHTGRYAKNFGAGGEGWGVGTEQNREEYKIISTSTEHNIQVMRKKNKHCSETSLWQL